MRVHVTIKKFQEHCKLTLIVSINYSLWRNIGVCVYTYIYTHKCVLCVCVCKRKIK